MAIRILLTRHGETDWNRTHRFQGRQGLPLNEKGREQAGSLAMALKNEPLAAIYSSPLKRALETARIIGAYHPSVPAYEDKGLVEMDLGKFDGMEAKKWAREYPDFLEAWQKDPSNVRMPGGETLQEVQDRAMDAIKRITQSYPTDTTILVSSHNFVNLVILCRAKKIPLARFREIPQGTAALNILYKKREGLWAEVVNDQTHIQSEAGPDTSKKYRG